MVSVGSGVVVGSGVGVGSGVVVGSELGVGSTPPPRCCQALWLQDFRRKKRNQIRIIKRVSLKICIIRAHQEAIALIKACTPNTTDHPKRVPSEPKANPPKTPNKGLDFSQQFRCLKGRLRCPPTRAPTTANTNPVYTITCGSPPNNQTVAPSPKPNNNPAGALINTK